MKKNIWKRVHYCGNGYKGRVILSHGIRFCGFCGHESKGKNHSKDTSSRMIQVDPSRFW